MEGGLGCWKWTEIVTCGELNVSCVRGEGSCK